MSTGGLSDIITFIENLKTLDFYDGLEECCENIEFIDFAKRCLTGGCWSWNDFVEWTDKVHDVYLADELPPAIVVFFTAMFGFFGVNGNNESLSGAHQLVAPGLAMVIAIAVGAMSGIYVANKTVMYAMEANTKLRFEDYNVEDSFLSNFAGLFVTYNIALYLGAAAILIVVPYFITAELFENIDGKDAYTLMGMGAMVVAGEWASAFALGEVADKLLGWFLEIRVQEVLTSDDRDISGWAFFVDVINQSILTSGYFMFSILMPAGTWTYAHYLLTGEIDWNFPYIREIWPFSMFVEGASDDTPTPAPEPAPDA